MRAGAKQAVNLKVIKKTTGGTAIIFPNDRNHCRRLWEEVTADVPISQDVTSLLCCLRGLLGPAGRL